jgi:hypothetical protein
MITAKQPNFQNRTAAFTSGGFFIVERNEDVHDSQTVLKIIINNAHNLNEKFRIYIQKMTEDVFLFTILLTFFAKRIII